MTNALEPHPLVWESRVRGSLLGLALGESLAFDQSPTGTLNAGSCTQLAAFTIEGTIRAAARSLHLGICHPPSVLWSAYCRWGVLQGVLPAGAIPLDGWLKDLPCLRERRGNAPATVTAIRDNGAGSRDTPTGESLGWHSLVRSLPLAALSDRAHWSDTLMAAEAAALTHGHPRAWSTAAAGARLINRLLAAPPGGYDLPGVVTDALPGLDEEVAAGLRTALWAAGTRPGQRDVMLSLAASAGAPAVLLGGVSAAASFPGPGNAAVAMRFAATAEAGEGVCAMTGAVLGALYGVEVWPVAVLVRHELVWALDVLARDLVRQLMDNPDGGPYDEPLWGSRYPGW